MSVLIALQKMLWNEFSDEFNRLYLDEEFNIKNEIHDAIQKLVEEKEWIAEEYGVVNRFPYDVRPYRHLYITIKSGKCKQEALLELRDVLPKALKFIEIRR